MEGGVFRILVVDDDSDILELLKYNLEKQGFKVKTLADSRKTLQVARSFDPDLIILDVMMPYLNGIEICRELRSLNRFENTYIFFLTAKCDPFYQQAALKIGGDDYIEKITGLRALTCKINAVLKNPDKMITLENLLHNIWGSAIYLAESSVETYLQNLQKKIGKGFIQRVQPGSYRFIPK